MFSDNILKKFKKSPSILLFSKISEDLFSVIDNFFKNLHPLFKIYSLFFVFFFLCLCFCFLSCFLIKKNQKFSSDYCGGKKKFCPHLNYWGRVPVNWVYTIQALAEWSHLTHLN